MVDFRKKLLGLGLLATAFAGISYGQILCPGATVPPGTAANQLRIEGTNEEVSDVTISCGAGSTLATGTLTVMLNSSVVTSKNADAVVIVNGTPYTGTVSGNSVVFSAVAFPATAFSITTKNIRVNASLLALGAQVNETVLITNAGVAIFSLQGQLVGIVYQGFNPAAVTAHTVTQSYLICKGSPVAGTPSATITLSEGFAGAYKTQTGAGLCGSGACSATNGEQGTYTPGGAVGTATHGTRFTLAFAGLAPGITLYIPTTVTGTPASINEGSTITMTLGTTATGVLVPATAAANSAAVTGSAIYAALTTSAAGTATAWYDVTATDNTVPLESVNIPVYASAAANFSAVSLAAFTVTVTPDSAIPASAVPDIPTFAAQTPAALSLSAYSLCQTTLLFPFVSTNGVETGIALANTSVDPGNIGGGGATANGGSCALNFYGALASAPSTPLTGVSNLPAPNPTGGSTAYVQPAGTTNAFGIMASGLVPTGFSGYMIAQCNYLYGHGFAYIAYQLGTSSGATMGYLADVILTRPFAATNETLGN